MDEFGGEIDEPDGWWLNGIGGGGNEPVLDMYAAFFQGKKSGETRLSYSPLINRENARIKQKSAEDAAFAKEVNRPVGSNKAMASALAFGGTAAVSDGPLLVGDAIGIAAIGVTAAIVYTPGLVDKMNREIDGIRKRVAGPPGFAYALTVRNSGKYTSVRGGSVMLNAGDFWKYGETTQGFGRYTQKELNTMVPGGVNMMPIFFGSQMDIKIMEKKMIYGHFFINGSLPLGNSIFR